MPGFVEKHKDYITEAALYFDSKANPVFSLAYDGKEMPFLNDKEFEDYLVMATRYKASLLRIATQEMLAMKERRTSQKEPSLLCMMRPAFQRRICCI